MEKLSTIQKRENLNEVYRSGDPGPGGAHHDYCVYLAGANQHEGPCDKTRAVVAIEFQKGPRKAADARHGILDTDLLEIVRDRLRAFCAGDMADKHTELALSHVEAALFHLNYRVEDRIARGVLGTTEK